MREEPVWAELQIPQGVRAMSTPKMRTIRLRSKLIFRMVKPHNLFHKIANKQLFHVPNLPEKVSNAYDKQHKPNFTFP